MHWTYGLGQIISLEERDLLGLKTQYYAVQIRDLTVWVPSDAELEHRLCSPTSKSGFQELFAILSNPGEPLPDDFVEASELTFLSTLSYKVCPDCLRGPSMAVSLWKFEPHP